MGCPINELTYVMASVGNLVGLPQVAKGDLPQPSVPDDWGRRRYVMIPVAYVRITLTWANSRVA